MAQLGSGQPAGVAHHGRGVAIGALITAAAVALALLIVRTDGYAATSVQPDPQSVWVTNGADLLVGRVNTQIDELDSAALLDNGRSDVLQDGRTVVVLDASAHRVRSLDVASVTLSPPVPVPADAAVTLAGDRLAVADRTTGAVWIAPVAGLTPRSFTDAPPSLVAAARPMLAGATDGTIAIAAPGDATVRVVPPGSSTARRVRLAAAPGRIPASGARAPELTLVGDVPVVLDTAGHRILTPGRAIPLPARDRTGVLQQPGPKSDSVLLETESALLRIPLDGGPAQRFDPGVTGRPTAPVWLGGCAHAAWSSVTPTYLRWCGSTPDIRPIPGAEASAPGDSARDDSARDDSARDDSARDDSARDDNSRDDNGGEDNTGPLTFRVNGSSIVLNDIRTGNVWIADRTMVLINNWDQVAPQRTDSVPDSAQGSGDSRSTTLTLSRTNCAGSPAPPSARPDDFGIRAGRPTLLPVMANDAVSECSVTRIASVSPLPPDIGTVTVVNGATALQVLTDADTHGTLPPVEYQLSDGLGHTSRASVSIHIAPDGTDAPPTKLRDSATVVALGGTATTNVLADWISPVGNSLFLTDARSDDPDDDVGFTPDGTVTVRDGGTGAPSKHTVTFTVSDGTDTARGVLTVQVLPTTSVVPVTSPVYARGTTGNPITIHPLATVLSVGPDPLKLLAVSPSGRHPQPHLQTAADTGAGTVTVTAPRPGIYLLDFQVASGTHSATGVIRVDVTAPTDDPTPIPVTDTAYLPQGGTTRVDLVANDIDPTGGVLAVQQISLDDDSPLVVTVSDMHIATISATAALPAAGVWFSYTVAGSGPPATGWVHVIAVPPDAASAPVVSPISLTVRAGDAATVSVGGASGAGATRDPGRSALTVAPFRALPAGSGLLFADGSRIRYLAPPDSPARTIDTSYTVTNTAGHSATAALHLTVVPRGTNHPPAVPELATARVFAGDTVDVPLPLERVDPDGDWAIATGIADPPTAGTATISGPQTARFTAPDQPGTITFDYTVTDPFGAHSIGTVEVGVIARPDAVAPPVAPDLTATVAPGGAASVDVLGAVSDPSGLPVAFADPGLTARGGAGVRGRIEDDAVVVTAGRRATVVPLTYTVRNSAGLSASGVITVTVSPDAPSIPPVARDAYVSADMVAADGRTAVVDVSRLVSNPGGRPGDLTLHIPAADGRAATAAGPMALRITLTGSRQVLAYQVRNAKGLTASAFVVVPGRDELLPKGDATGERGDVSRGGAPPSSNAPTATGAAPTTAPPSEAAGEAGRLHTTAPTTTAPHTTAPTTTAPTTTAPTTTAPTTTAPGSPAPPAPVVSDLQVRVAAGASATVLLTGMVRHADRYQHLTFRLVTPGRDGLSAGVHGDALTVAAGAAVPAGTAASLTVSIDDGTHHPATATVTVTVTATTAARPTVPDRRITTQQGTAVTVDALTGAGNPLSARGPLRLTAATVTSGAATAHFRPGGTLTVTPAAGETGSVTVQVTATDPAKRTATATVTVTVLGRPDPPRDVTLHGFGDGSVTLTWSAPDDHGAAITDYLVTAAGVNADCGAKTTCLIAGLTNGRSYEFRVRARNRIGTSGPSAPVVATPDVRPGAPGRPAASPGDQQLHFTWTAPAGAAVDHYQAVLTPAPEQGSASLATTATSITFEHLRNGTPYRLTVTAVSATGINGPSAVSDPATPITAPGAPGTPRLSYRGGSSGGAIDVAWDAPASDGGDPALTYTVHFSGPGGDGTVAAKTARTASITGATLGATYAVWVVAHNSVGVSPASGRAAITPTTPPQQVTGLQARPTGASGTVALTWRAPADGGRPISAYQVRHRTADGAYGSWRTVPNATTTSVTGLTNGTKYQFEVKACNGDASCGAESAPAIANPYAPPGAVSNLSARGTGTSGRVTATWSAPSAGGRAIVTYQYRYKKDSSGSFYTGWKNTPDGTATSMTLGGLSDGVQYRFQVRAINRTESGDPAGGTHTGQASNADPATPCRPPDKMAAPTGKNVTQTKITLHWSAPFDGGRAIAKYQYRIGGGSWKDAGSGTSHTVTGLKAGTSYKFQVKACNAVGCGAASAARSIKTKTEPTVSLVHGAPISNGQCNVECYYFKVKCSNLKAGSYKVTIYLSGKVFRTYQWSLGTSGSKQATSYAGRNPSRTAKVTLVGPSGTVTSPTRTWP